MLCVCRPFPPSGCSIYPLDKGLFYKVIAQFNHNHNTLHFTAIVVLHQTKQHNAASACDYK